MITQHSFSVLPEGSTLRRRWTVSATYYRDGMWQVTCDGYFFDRDGEVASSLNDGLFDEATALDLAERLASTVRLYTQFGEMTAAEALERGLA